MTKVLYSFRRCPYAMRARMALKVSGAEYEHREILLRDKPKSMLQASSKATVPVLILDDGHVIDESFDVMLWALENDDPLGWMEPGLEAMKPVIEEISEDFKTHLDRYKYASRYNDDADRFSVDITHRDKAVEILQKFERRLSKSKYLMGETASLADYATFPFIRQFANVEREWWDKPQFPNLHLWLEGFLASEIFLDIMQKHALWTDPQS